MGTFLSLSGVIGKAPDAVAGCLANYAKAAGGGLLQEPADPDHDNFCVIESAKGNTTVLYPFSYGEWDASSRYLSKELQTPVFSCHIHDGDLWMYILYVNGEVADLFNPIPDYWEAIPEEEMDSWLGDARAVAAYIPGLDPKDIERYLVRWDPETREGKAYADDVFGFGDWQLLDFLKKLGLPYPLDDDGNPKGRVYQLWTRELPLQQQAPNIDEDVSDPEGDDHKKPWWKFW